MPELPEVETSRRGIEPHILKQTIKKLTVRQRKLRWLVPTSLPLKATGKKVLAVKRRAKYILIELDNGHIIIHLGMSGSLRICPAGSTPEKHDHVELQLSNGKVMRLRDPRKFGCVLWTEKPVDQHKLIASLGPEPLDTSFNADYLHSRASKRSCSIKSFIMNSQVVVGVGNIYASESLFKAGINPKTRAGRISLSRMEKLVNAIKLTLTDSIKQGGTTLRDFTSEDGKPGYFAQQLLVYGLTDSPCSVCKTPIRQFTQQQRSTFYCPHCQH